MHVCVCAMSHTLNESHVILWRLEATPRLNFITTLENQVSFTTVSGHFNEKAQKL